MTWVLLFVVVGRDVEVKDAEGNVWSLENLSTQRWLEGHGPGAEVVIGWMHERAVRLFREGRDEQAVWLRKLAEDAQREVVPLLQKSAAQHEKDYPAKIGGVS